MQKRSLTRQKICAAAIQLIEVNGLEKLSMRKLASKLNVEAASLYNHIANKSELFESIQEYVYSQIPTSFPEKIWQDHFSNLAIVTRQSLLQVPNVAVLFATRPTITASALKQAEITLNMLIESGFKKSEVLSIYRNLHIFIIGHVLVEVGRVPGETTDSNEPSFENINIDEYPILKKTFSYKSNVDFEKGFKLGLKNIIRGLETLLRG